MTDGAALRTEDIGTVEDRFFTLRDFRLANGTVMPEARIVYETYGRLNLLGTNAIVLFHALSGNQHASGICHTVPNTGERWTEDCQRG